MKKHLNFFEKSSQRGVATGDFWYGFCLAEGIGIKMQLSRVLNE
jgi:hypothetical protein